MARTSTKVGVWNQALVNIGETKLIEDAEETSEAAEICRLFWDDLLVELLGVFAWPFATTQAALSEVGSVTRIGWERVYALPADCVLPLALLAEGQRIRLWGVKDRVPFELQNAGEGLYLLTDTGPEDFDVLEYVARPQSTDETDPADYVASYSRPFVKALSWAIGEKLALGLRKDMALGDKCVARTQLHLAEAVAQARNAMTPDLEPETPSIAARS